MTVVYSAVEKNKRIKGIMGAASGNLVEWFDFYIYAVFVVYFQKALTSPEISENESGLYVWGVFAASFFMRPIGSWLFGWMADKYGRRQSMMASILLMAISSFAFACLPTYAQVGAIAPFLLLAVRLLQGLSVGGEYGAVATYMSEIGLKGRRGFFSSFQYVTLVGGQLLASLLSVIIMLMLVSEKTLYNGGWRIPFVIGGVAALLSLFARSHLEETLSTEEKSKVESGSLWALLSTYWKPFLLVVGYTSAGSLSFYVLTVYSKTYLTNLGVASETVGVMMTCALFVLMIAQPFFGALSDRIGRRTMMLLFSALMAIFIYPIMGLAMPAANASPVLLTLLLIVLFLILSFYTSIGGIVKAEMFPAHVRALGVGVSYAIGNAIFGGSAPAVALKFKEVGLQNEFFIYVIVMLIVCFLCSWQLPKKADYLEDDH
ncbi:MFS transporter [Acinetobacter sp. c3-l95]|uniref:MFS transporter n=1 Tax=Acinetobacter sp. c3-l95 TaxID=3342804 RepID=UPI0035BA8554